ncbi:MAG: hypothetical protein O7F70_03860 [Gemmatimonadetes bacterium]|nr:hypothetical protein [Gemmatimonadota bacterium]
MTTTLDMATIQRGARVRGSPFFNSTVKLVGVEIGGDALELNMIAWPVSTNGTAAGRITSAVYSPRLEKNIGYAMVPIELSTIGSSFGVATPNGDRQATVVEKPFVDPKKAVPKS